MEQTYEKILTDKEFRDIVAPFVKAYKKKKEGELDLHFNVKYNGKDIGISVIKNEEYFLLICDIFIIDDNKEELFWESIGKTHFIESIGNTYIEIVDFLAYEYQREVNNGEKR